MFRVAHGFMIYMSSCKIHFNSSVQTCTYLLAVYFEHNCFKWDRKKGSRCDQPPQISSGQWKSSSTAIHRIWLALIFPCMKAFKTPPLCLRLIRNAVPPDDRGAGVVICAVWFHYVCVRNEFLRRILIWLIQHFWLLWFKRWMFVLVYTCAVMNSWLGVGVCFAVGVLFVWLRKAARRVHMTVGCVCVILWWVEASLRQWMRLLCWFISSAERMRLPF